MGKNPHVVNPDRLPRVFSFLPSSRETGVGAKDLRETYDMIVSLDAPTLDRLGDLPTAWPANAVRANIDHHAANEKFMSLNWVDASYSSTGEMILDLADSAGWRVPPAAATALYVAVITDTNRFTLPNTTRETFVAAARLVQLGAAHVEAAERLYYGDPLGLIRLRGMCLESLHLALDGKVAVANLTREMFAGTATDSMDTQEFAEIPRSVHGITVAVLLREMEGGQTKVSLRGRQDFDVERIARRFGGGGHPQAAGIVMDGTLREVEDKLVAAISAVLKEKGS
jgi:phosphoesterase RecJ-like protein